MPLKYSTEPQDRQHYTKQYDAFYSRFANSYDWLVRFTPLWRNWLDNVLPWIQGPRVLEASTGTGYLLTRCAGTYETYGIDLNPDLVLIARKNLLRSSQESQIQVANVESLPYAGATFDSIINTMAFTAYPDGRGAMEEMSRVLKPGGRLVILDISYPLDQNRLGVLLTRAWKASGDIIRDMPSLLETSGFQFTDQEVGGFGSVHLYVAAKPAQNGT
jgi:ubiquinone/menaquinone biosynthesis C-methylase UbiE